MARIGQFAGASFQFGAPLLSVHPIDNRMEPEEPKVRIDLDAPIRRPDLGRDSEVTPLPTIRVE